MVYKNCKNCGKKYYKSPYDKGRYQFYCSICGFKKFEQDQKEMVKQQQMGFPASEAKTNVGTISNSFCGLRRTDNEEDYLDSTRCEYSKTEVEEMKIELQQLMFRKANLKQTIRKLYDNINSCDEKIEKIKCKLSVAEHEQQLRKKLRRETRELIPSLESIEKNTKTVYRNINELLNDSDDDCIIIKDIKDPFTNK